MEHDKGGLVNLTLDDKEEENGVFRYGVFQTQAQTPDISSEQIQTMYGTESLPMFQWVRTIQTGERTYNPEDPQDRALLEQYEETVGDDPPEGYMTPEMIREQLKKDVATSAAQYVGSNIGAALADPNVTGSIPGQALRGVGASIGFDLPSERLADSVSKGNQLLAKELIPPDRSYYPQLANREIAIETGNVKIYDDLVKADPSGSAALGATNRTFKPTDVQTATSANPADSANLDMTSAISATSSAPTYLENVGSRLTDFSPGGAARTNVSQAGIGGIFNFGVQLAMGKDPEDAAKSAGAGAIGTFLGNALLPGLGGVIGGSIGSALGGRVICNELYRQGFMTKKQVMLDYQFTRDYLTPIHVSGYHKWAVTAVRLMRKGKGIRFWKHIATHRANEIEHIYGLRSKGDLLGKIYRKIFEPICWIIGNFCDDSDWSVLYEAKEY